MIETSSEDWESDIDDKKKVVKKSKGKKGKDKKVKGTVDLNDIHAGVDDSMSPNSFDVLHPSGRKTALTRGHSDEDFRSEGNDSSSDQEEEKKSPKTKGRRQAAKRTKPESPPRPHKRGKKGKPEISRHQFKPGKQFISKNKKESKFKKKVVKKPIIIEEDDNMYDQQETIMTKRSDAFMEFGSQLKPEITEVKLLEVDYEKEVEADDEDIVYPLSIKYNPKKERKIMICRYVFLALILVIFFPINLITSLAGLRTDVRLGYFANKVT